jgi:methionyl-tRNA formyltransferase
MRTVVVGNRKLARHLFRHLLDEDWTVVGALVPEGKLASTQANFAPFDELVTETDCQLHKTTDINARETHAWLKEIEPDVCICGGWSQVIDEQILGVPDHGFLGFHSSRLPEGRGGAPVNWSMIDGADEMWISLFYYVEEVDAGEVLARGSVPVSFRDDVATVFDALAVEACRLLSTIRPQFESDDVDAEPQSLRDATYRPRRQPQDGLIDWNRNPVAQYGWVRAQTDPYPGAYTFHDGTKLTVWRGEPIEKSIGDTQPGEILNVVDGEGVDVRSGDGVFRLRRIKPDERPSRWADQYAQDSDLAPGDRLGREFGPGDCLYKGIRGSTGDTSFDTNLSVGTTGELDLVAFSGSRNSLQVRVTLDERKIFTKSVLVEDAYRNTVDYSLSEPGTYTVTVEFERNSEHIDTRYLKVFVHD